eukprot:Transcript_14737.p2 GENE.Transcript_14737~~Transcript_14737.p2  ORF type:complete len:446 (-),score=153.91 Transcript_14737:1909-3246(-)
MRRLISRMEQSPLCLAELLAAPVEYHNQRLEFLGDAALEFVTSHHLFCLFASAEEGSLSDYRTALVNNKGIATFGTRLGLHSFVLRGPLSPNGVAWEMDPLEAEKVVADCFEAFFGALYLDQGLGACRALLSKCIFWTVSELPLRRCWLLATSQPYKPPETMPRRRNDPEQAQLHAFEAATGLRFGQLGLLRQAFTHPSYFTDRKDFVQPPPLPCGGPRHNQRLEYLGDAVLQLASSDFLFHVFPEHQEGQLSMLRASLVNNSLICDVAATCGMHHCMRYYHEAMDEPGRARRAMLADSFEAFLGALFLDKQPLGLAHAKAFTHSMLFSLTPQTIEERRWMDPKMRLQYCLNEFNTHEGLEGSRQALRKTFCVLDEWGPSHERMYLVGCYINEQLIAQARGQSLMDAQMGAALAASKALGLDGDGARPGGGGGGGSSEAPGSTDA